MKNNEFGRLFNNAGNGKYTTPESLENVIRYVNRTGRKSDEDLVAWGGIGITEFHSTDTICRQFKKVQALYMRNGDFGRYIDHEYFSFTSDAEDLLSRYSIDIDKIARDMAYDFYLPDYYQVVYAVHKSEKEDSKLHIHFAVNTVGLEGKKRRENMSQTKEREERFNKIVLNEIVSIQRLQNSQSP